MLANLNHHNLIHIAILIKILIILSPLMTNIYLTYNYYQTTDKAHRELVPLRTNNPFDKCINKNYDVY